MNALQDWASRWSIPAPALADLRASLGMLDAPAPADWTVRIDGAVRGACFRDAAGDRIAGGTVALRAVDAGLRFDADFAGGLEPLIPAEYRDFFAGQSEITAQGVTRTGGGLNLDGFAVLNDALDLSGRAETADDWFPRRLSLEGTLGDPTGPAITLPVPGAETTLNSASLYVTLGDGDRWTGRLALDRLSAADILVEDFTLDMGGRARNLDDPAARDLSITLEGLATGVSSADPDIGNALGDRIDIFLDAAIPPEGPARIDQLQVSGDGLSAFASGTVRDLVYTGTTALRVSKLSPLSGLVVRDLGGQERSTPRYKSLFCLREGLA